MSHQEAEFTTKVKPWIRENLPTCAWEAKHTRGEDSFRMSELHEHQRDALDAVESRYGYCYKIPDDGRTHKPFDGFNLKMELSFVIIAFPKEFLVIPANKLADHKEPSLSFERAIEMASVRRPLKVLN